MERVKPGKHAHDRYIVNQKDSALQVATTSREGGRPAPATPLVLAGIFGPSLHLTCEALRLMRGDILGLMQMQTT